VNAFVWRTCGANIYSPLAPGKQCTMHSCIGTLQWASTSPLKSSPSRGGIWTPSNTWFLGPIWVSPPNGISVNWAVFAQLTHRPPKVKAHHVRAASFWENARKLKSFKNSWNSYFLRTFLCMLNVRELFYKCMKVYYWILSNNYFKIRDECVLPCTALSAQTVSYRSKRIMSTNFPSWLHALPG